MEVECELVHECSREKVMPQWIIYIPLDDKRRFVVKLYGVPKINSNIWIKFWLLVLLIIIPIHEEGSGDVGSIFA